MIIPRLLKPYHCTGAASRMLYAFSSRSRHKLRQDSKINDSASGDTTAATGNQLETPRVTIEVPQTEKFAIDSTLLLSEEDQKDFYRLKDSFTLEDLLEARVHLGHKERMLNPHMRPYIFGKRLGVLIFDLEETARLLQQALHVAAEIAYRDGIILFVHSSRQTGHLVEDAAKECGEYAHCRRWRNEVFTNAQAVFGSITRLPDLVVLFSVLRNVEQTHGAVIMAAKMLLPTVGICDTNANPTLVTYPVPGNDDSPQSIELYCRLFKTAILNGKAKREEILKKYGQDFYNKTLETTTS